jgi:formate dehydrogenase subunit delta
MSPDKLAYMANQIGKFFASQKPGAAVDGIADHLMKFWDPRMRRTLVAHLHEVSLEPAVREAVERLRG